MICYMHTIMIIDETMNAARITVSISYICSNVQESENPIRILSFSRTGAGIGVIQLPLAFPCHYFFSFGQHFCVQSLDQTTVAL